MTPLEALQLVLDAARQTQRLNAGCRHTEGVADLQAEAIRKVEHFCDNFQFSISTSE
jgi:hypothetical protein